MRRRGTLFVLPVVMALLWPPATVVAQSGYLVADRGTEVLYASEEWLAPAEHLSTGGLFYFFVDDGVHGRELWRSDGTSLGTFLVRDICPGSCGSRAGWLGLIAALGERVLFTANDGIHGLELWISDGTALGTAMVADLHPGYDSSTPYLLTSATGQVFFLARRANGTTALWRSDGTTPGTYVVAPLDPLQSFQPSAIFASPDRLFLCEAELDGQEGLWTSDGTSGGTSFVAGVACAQSWGLPKRRAAAVAADGVFYFANEGDLWRSDGTGAGTVRVKDLYPGSPANGLYAFVFRAGELLFGAADPLGGGDLWRSDGTELGTSAISLADGAEAQIAGGTWAVAGSNYYFAAADPTHGREPWVYDGITAQRIADLVPGPSSSISTFWWEPYLFEPFGDGLLFAADDGVFGRELWRTDGEASGTSRISDFAPGAPGFRLPFHWGGYFASLDGRPIVLAHQPDVGLRLWRLNAAGTALDSVKLVRDQTSLFLERATDRELMLEDFRNRDCFEGVGNRLAFDERLEETVQQNLLTTRGGLGDFDVVISGIPYSESPCAAVGDRLAYFYQSGPPSNTPTLDSVRLATGELEFLLGGPDLSLHGLPTFVPSSGGLRFLSATALYETDGSFAGTVTRATDVGAWGGRIEPFLDELVVAGSSLAITDPKESSGARTLLSGDPVVLYVEPEAVSLGEILTFAAWDPMHGTEIWASDGTTEGTGLLVDARPGPESLFRGISLDRYAELREPRLVGAGAFAIFAGRTAAAGEEVWVTDGSALGTHLLRDVYPGDYPSTPRNLTRFGDRVFFTAESELEGLELWATDGTYEGTVLVKDIAPGAASSLPDDLVVRDGVLYFSAWSPNFGREAWKSDGTSAGTIRITDIAPGPKSSSPQRFARAGNRLFFSATDHVHGYELWAISDDGGTPLFLDDFENESTSRWSEVEP